MAQETAFKSMVVTDPHMTGIGNVDSYLYQMEQQRSIIDGLQYRVQHGGQCGYHYNPYYTNGYGYGDIYGAYPGDVLSAAHVAYSDPNAIPLSADSDQDVADELSTGEIAGIAIGSVVALALLIFLLYLCMNSGGRSRRMPDQQQMPQTNAYGFDNTMTQSSEGGYQMK
jgi:hypothetical protein